MGPYAPVDIYDDDDELLKNGGYAPVMPPAAPDTAAAAPAPTPAAPPVSLASSPASPYPAPVMAAPPMGSTEDLEDRATAHPQYAPVGSPNAAPVAPRPQWKDYAPVQPHGWQRGLGALFTGLAAFHSPELGKQVYDELYTAPEQRAEEKYKNAVAEYDAPTAERAKDAETEQREAAADKDRADAENVRNPRPGNTPEEVTLHDLMTGNNGGPRINPATKQPYSYIDALGAVNKAKLEGKPTPSETQEQNKLNFQGVIGKLDKAGLSTDPKALDKSLDAALKNGVITPEEHASARAYQSANSTPATNLTVHMAGNDEAAKNAINKMFEGSEVIAHMPDGRRVQMSYADAQAQNIPPERLVKLNAKEAQETRDKAANIETTFKGLDRYRNNLKTIGPKLSDDERSALKVLTSHSEQTASVLSGLLDDLPIAGPLNSYANKLMEGSMTSKQYRQLKSPEAKKLVSDYYTAVIDNFASMKARLGSVGRNPAQLQAEINTIPLPYLDWESANPQFENKRASLAGFAASMPEIYKPPQK